MYQQKPEATGRKPVENVDVSTKSSSSSTKIGSVDVSTKTKNLRQQEESQWKMLIYQQNQVQAPPK